MVWRDIPALRGQSFELLLDYNRIKEGWGLLLCGLWDVAALQHQAAVCSNVSSTCGCRERLVVFLLSSNFQSWGHKLGRIYRSHL